MTNNDIARQLRYIFNIKSAEFVTIMDSVGYSATLNLVDSWLKKEEDERYQEMLDPELALFLNGLIVKFRGKSDRPFPPPEDPLTNNMILRKLKIALDLKSEDILDLIESTGFKLGRHELSAFFRKPSQRQYRPCKDQVLRKLLFGLKLKYQLENTKPTKGKNQE